MEKRELILETALELFAKQGYHNTTITQITSKAGISKGLIYNYFESKEELVKAILDDGLDQLIGIFDRNHDGVIEKSEMEYFIKNLFHYLKESREFWKLYFNIAVQPDIIELVSGKISEYFAPMMKMATDYFTSLGFKNPQMEATLFGALIDGISFHYVLNPELLPIDEIQNELMNKYCNINNNNK